MPLSIVFHLYCGGLNKWDKLVDTKEVTRSRKSKKDRQYNDQKKKGNRTNNDLHNTTQKIQDWAIPSHSLINNQLNQNIILWISL